MSDEWQQSDAEERAAVAVMPAGTRPHYELNDGTCVTCGKPWMCQTAAEATQ